MIQHAQGKSEAVQSAISYGSGGGLASFAMLTDVATVAQSLALILGCFVVLIRLIHDSIRLFIFLRSILGKSSKAQEK